MTFAVERETRTMLRRFIPALIALSVLTITLQARSVVGATTETPLQRGPQGPGALEHTALYTKMVHANEALHSYKSHVHLAIAMHSFPFLSPTLEGTAYYKAPDKNAIVFDEVPALASLFKKVFPRLDPPAQWPRLYRISVLTSGGGHTIFRLEPIKYGTIAHLDVMVDESTGIALGYTYSYRNGGYVHFDQTIARISGVYVVTALKGHVQLPSTTADADSTFSDYHINVPVNDKLFTAQSS